MAAEVRKSDYFHMEDRIVCREVALVLELVQHIYPDFDT
jgi:hypothetical protein